jgi:hypothetical protein
VVVVVAHDVQLVGRAGLRLADEAVHLAAVEVDVEGGHPVQPTVVLVGRVVPGLHAIPGGRVGDADREVPVGVSRQAVRAREGPEVVIERTVLLQMMTMCWIMSNPLPAASAAVHRPPGSSRSPADSLASATRAQIASMEGTRRPVNQCLAVRRITSDPFMADHPELLAAPAQPSRTIARCPTACRQYLA